MIGKWDYFLWESACIMFFILAWPFQRNDRQSFFQNMAIWQGSKQYPWWFRTSGETTCNASVDFSLVLKGPVVAGLRRQPHGHTAAIFGAFTFILLQRLNLWKFPHSLSSSTVPVKDWVARKARGLALWLSGLLLNPTVDNDFFVMLGPSSGLRSSYSLSLSEYSSVYIFAKVCTILS